MTLPELHKEVLWAAKYFFVSHVGRAFRHKYCEGCYDDDDMHPSQTQHMDVLGCFQPWCNMPDLRALNHLLLQNFNLDSDNYNITLCVDEVKDLLIMHSRDDPKFSEREGLIAKCENIWPETYSFSCSVMKNEQLFF